ncbi:UNVERIFIED_CONTAM: hypothetical protein PYX00_006930 [Menopon gallinae]|uniref:Uncharacterized protein n=1 Tax=Menopon gallinae TaxID=328185 RepID=A0AAW2HHT7_9NEOP
MASESEVQDYPYGEYDGEGGEYGGRYIGDKSSWRFGNVQFDTDEPGIITDQHLKFISRELGLIKLCWDDVQLPPYDGRVHYPWSHTHNNEKEKILLWYAENFRRQYVVKYPTRRPLLLACNNECGMQKMVCTTIRPTTMKYPEFHTWKGCAAFVADHLTYEPLENPTVLVSLFRFTSSFGSCIFRSVHEKVSGGR